MVWSAVLPSLFLDSSRSANETSGSLSSHSSSSGKLDQSIEPLHTLQARLEEMVGHNICTILILKLLFFLLYIWIPSCSLMYLCLPYSRKLGLFFSILDARIRECRMDKFRNVYTEKYSSDKDHFAKVINSDSFLYKLNILNCRKTQTVGQLYKLQLQIALIMLWKQAFISKE